MPVGGGAVHSYIAVKDNAGRIVAEYHGFPYDRETGDYEGDNPLAFTPLSNFQLRAIQRPDEHWPSSRYPQVHDEEVFRGSRSQVELIQAEMNQAAKDINRLNLDYGGVHFLSESRNSNSVYRTLMRVADGKALDIGAGRIEVPDRLLQDNITFDSQSRSSWAPGIHRDLLSDGIAPSTKKMPQLFGNKS